MSDVHARILLWGIEGCGKTTTLQTIHDKLRADLRGELRMVVEDTLGLAVHGETSTRYRLRWTSDETDQDLNQLLNLNLPQN